MISAQLRDKASRVKDSRLRRLLLEAAEELEGREVDAAKAAYAIGTTLELRVGNITARHVFARVFDSGGHAGEAFFHRNVIEELTGEAGFEEGDWLRLNVTLASRSKFPREEGE